MATRKRREANGHLQPGGEGGGGGGEVIGGARLSFSPLPPRPFITRRARFFPRKRNGKPVVRLVYIRLCPASTKSATIPKFSHSNLPLSLPLPPPLIPITPTPFSVHCWPLFELARAPLTSWQCLGSASCNIVATRCSLRSGNTPDTVGAILQHNIAAPPLSCKEMLRVSHLPCVAVYELI